MSIRFIAVKCPQCDADLSIEEGRTFAFCSYCGAKVIIKDENEHIYRNIDEARIKESETERIIRLRELELEEKERLHGRKTKMIVYVIALIFTAIGALVCIVSINGIWGILIGGYIALFAYSKNRKKEEDT